MILEGGTGKIGGDRQNWGGQFDLFHCIVPICEKKNKRNIVTRFSFRVR